MTPLSTNHSDEVASVGMPGIMGQADDAEAIFDPYGVAGADQYTDRKPTPMK